MNPNKNPEEYKQLEEKYDTSKIKSPKAQNKISVKGNKIQPLVNDTMREILLRADSNTIGQYCKTNKHALKLCDDKSFWRDKFSYYNFYFPVVIEYMSYLRLFRFIQEQMKDVEIILKINEIEKNRNYNKTKGIIKVRIEYMDVDNLDDLLSIKFERDNGFINFIIFELTDDGYMVKLEKLHKPFINIGYKNLNDIVKIFSYALTDFGICEDDNDISFLSMDDEAFDEEDITDYYLNNNLVIASVRRGLWEAMLL